MAARTKHPRDKILDAALRLFVEKGYHNTSIPSICKLSGCPVGSVYHYFENKEQIASRLYEESLFLLLDEMRSAIDLSSDFRAQIGGAVRHMLAFVEGHPDKARYLLLARHNEFVRRKIPTLLGAFQRTLGEYARAQLERGMGRERLERMTMDVALTCLVALPLQYCQSWLDGDLATPPTEVADQLVLASWNALRSAPKNAENEGDRDQKTNNGSPTRGPDTEE